MHRPTRSERPRPISREAHRADLDGSSMAPRSSRAPSERDPSKSPDDRENLLATEDSEILSLSIDSPAGGSSDQPLGETASPSLASRADRLIRLQLPFSLPPPPASRRGFLLPDWLPRRTREAFVHEASRRRLDQAVTVHPAGRRGVPRQRSPTKGLGSSAWTSSPEAPTSC